MAELLNIDLLEKNILSLKKMNFQSFAIHHLANFNNFFHNIGSHEYEVEQQFGKRVDIRTVGPQSLIMINSVIYEYLNPSSKYHNDIISLRLPLDHYIKDNQLPATYSRKCTYEVISNAYALPIETIRRHCKIWLDTGIMKKSKERGLYTDFDVVFNSNLFRQTHFTIANKMIKAWEKLINNMNELDFIENKISFKPRSIDNIKQIEKLDYIKIIFNLNYFWYRASNYLKLSPLTFTELSVLSSAFYFKEEDKILYAHKNTDYYDNNILIPTNINSIANATLIPRETARRCVHSLIEKQILKKSSNLIFVSEKLLEGKIEVNKNVKKEIIRDSLIVLKTFDQALN